MTMDYTFSRSHVPLVTSFFDKNTNTISYVVADTTTKQCAIIDSVADYEPHGGSMYYESADKIIEHVVRHGYSVEWILETHVHADHLTAAKYLKEKLGGTIAMSKSITSVQKVFGDVFLEDESFARDGSQFDVLFEKDQAFTVGSIPAVVISVPGHTPADVAYLIGDAVFVGDTIFMPDYGSARCDFPGGNAEDLYESVRKLFELPDSTRMFMCHDYLPEGRTDYLWETTVGEEKAKNIHLATTISKEVFVTMRREKDKKLGMPKLIIPSLQVNMRAGNLPKSVNGKIFFKIPINDVFSRKQQ